VRLGDLEVGRIGFGAMRITGPGVWGEPRDPAAAKAVLRRAVELGVDFIDTADSYGPEVSERLIAEALHPYPEQLVIGTKGGHTRQGPGQWGSDCRPEALRKACEGSLRRLRLERIDLYQLHTSDGRVPWEESVGALAELRDEGKIRHVGLCNVGIEQIRRARQLVPIASVQNRYSLLERAFEDVLRHCEQEEIPFICWFPLEHGALGRRSSGLAGPGTPAQVALAWLLQRSPATLPIPGTCSLAHVAENVGALRVELAAEELSALEDYRLQGLAGARRSAKRLARRVVVERALPLLRR
jgi:aryl-alcohol dehydrogenase-like predicted oxidoreductase